MGLFHFLSFSHGFGPSPFAMRNPHRPYRCKSPSECTNMDDAGPFTNAFERKCTVMRHACAISMQKVPASLISMHLALGMHRYGRCGYDCDFARNEKPDPAPCNERAPTGLPPGPLWCRFGYRVNPGCWRFQRKPTRQKRLQRKRSRRSQPRHSWPRQMSPRRWRSKSRTSRGRCCKTRQTACR